MNDRSLALLELLINTKGFITIDSLAEKFNVSRRSIYNDIKLINDYLEESYNTSITNAYGKGIYLNEELKKSLKNCFEKEITSYYEFDKTDRGGWIFLYISCYFKESIFVDNLCELFQVSRNTVLNDLHNLKNTLSSHNISINFDIKRGYYLTGDEIEIRNQIMHYYMHLKRKELLPLVDERHLPEIKSLISEYEHSIKIKIADEYRHLLYAWFSLFRERIIQGYIVHLDKEEIAVIQTTKEFSTLQNIAYKMGSPTKKTYSFVELIYMTRFFLSAKVKSVQKHYTTTHIDQALHSVTTNMVNDFEKRAGVFFHEKSALHKNLFLHLKPTYYRLKYEIHIDNPLKEEVKKKYNAIFNLTDQVSYHFQEFVECDLSEDEVAYMAIHFGGWLKRNDLTIETRKLKIMLVCTNGIGIARIIENQIIYLFPEYEIVSISSISEYDSKEDWSDVVDFTVTTNHLKDRGVPIIKVNPLFTKNDRKELLSLGKIEQQVIGEYNRNDVNALINAISQHADIKNAEQLKEDIFKFMNEKNESADHSKPSLESLLPVNHIQVKDHIENWQQAIQIASEPLLKDKSINENYIERMIEIVMAQGTYMMVADNIAMPHATNFDGVKKTGLTILLLKEPVLMLDKKVRLFIVLASIDNENHLTAIAELTRLFRDKNTLQKLFDATDAKQLHTLLFPTKTGGIS